MSVTFQIEKITDVRDEVLPLLREHWDEIALNKDTVPLDPDWDTYAVLEAGGALHITTARDGAGRIVGYVSYILAGNMHYRSLLVAEGDIFYLAKDHRKGTTGLRLLRAAEQHVTAAARARAQAEPGRYTGVYILNKEKDHFRRGGRSIVGPVLERLGFTLIEHFYAKRASL